MHAANAVPSLHHILRLGLLALACLSVGSPRANAQFSFEFVQSIPATSGGAEICAFEPRTSTLYVTQPEGLDLYRFKNGTLTPAGTIDLRTVVPNLADVSSVAIDPAGRGLGATVVIPEHSDTTPGFVAIFDTASNEIVATLRTGFHPDMVTFTPDGRAILIANEGEPGDDADPAGGITVVKLRPVNTATDARTLTDDAAETFELESDYLALLAAPLVHGAAAEIRISPANFNTPWRDIEPEYIAADNKGAWVSLQENNCLARFDLSSRRWTALHSLGTIVQTIDASDADGGIHIDDTVPGMPMPDSIASFVAYGTRYIVTANEGDVRVDDHARFKNVTLDETVAAVLDALYPDLQGGVRDDTALGRLDISVYDGDTDADGVIEVPTMFGTRSMSIFDESGRLIADTGSTLEQLTALLSPERFNSNGAPDSFDARSDVRGPEPEGLALTTIDGRTYAFLGLERPSAVVMFEITDPTSPRVVDYFNTAAHSAIKGGGIAPEGLCVIHTDSDTFLVVACEVSGTLEVLRVAPDSP